MRVKIPTEQEPTLHSATPPETEAGSIPPLPPLAIDVLITLCSIKFLLHVFTSMRHYGYFRDELYYLDMARHLDWGYVDAAPLIAVYAKIAMLLGGSLAALRVLPALAGIALVALTILIARELGGGKYVQLLAGLAILVCPSVLIMDSLLTMNAFEPLYWIGCIWVIARILRTGDSRRWLWFGVLAGLGLENKHSTLSFGFAVAVALLLTQQRRVFAQKWIWIAGAIAVAIFLPNLIWQIQHHFPTIEDLSNVRREGKNVVLPPLSFIKEQIIDMHPILFPVWIAGLLWLLRDRRWRVLGVTFVVFFVLMEVAHAKNYYVFPIYPMLFAAGGLAIAGWLANRAAWTRVAVIAVIVLFAIPALPLATWMLPPDRLLAYQNAIGFKPAKAEVHHESLLPQPVADQSFQWLDSVIVCGILPRIEQPVEMDHEIAHLGIVDGLLRLRLPGRMRGGVIRKHADDLHLIEVLEGVVLEIGQFTADDEMEQLRLGAVWHDSSSSCVPGKAG